MIRKIIAALAFMLVLSGCAAKEYEWVIKIEGQPIDPHTFVSAQMQSYLKAQTVAEDSMNILSGEIDGISGSQWINNTAINTLKRNIFIDREFEKLNLRFSGEADSFIKRFGEEGWENVSVIYKNNGLDLDYYIDYLKSLYKEQLVFNAVFLYGNENSVTDREIEEYLNNNICRVSLFKIAKVNDDGSALAEEQKPQLQAIVDDVTDRINAGEKMADVAADSLSQSAVLLGSTADFSNGADYVTTVFISNSGTGQVYDFMEELFTKQEGLCIAYEMEDCFYICQKIPLCDTQVEYMYLKQDVANLLRDVEFEEMIKKACDVMAVEINEEAMAAYNPAKVKMTIE